MRTGRRSRWPNVLRRMIVGSMAFVGCSWLVGCFKYVMIDPALAPVGARARVELTSEGSERVSQTLNRENRGHIEGKVEEVYPDGGVLLTVASPPSGTRVGVSSRPLFSRVNVPGGDLLNLELKQLSKGRTAALVGAAAATATVIVIAAFDLSFGGNGEENGPPVNEIRIPVFSLQVGGR